MRLKAGFLERRNNMGLFAADGKLAGALNCIGNLIVLNILTLVCCIPVVTAGAAMTALYTMTMRIARKEDGKIISGYFRAFRDNFKQSTVLWLVFGGLMAFMAFDIYMLKTINGDFGQAYRILLFVLILCFQTELIHIYAVLARFENTTKKTAWNALLFIAGNLPQAVLMLAVTVSPLLLVSVSMRFVSVVFLIGLAGPAYLASLYFKEIFRKYEGPVPGAEMNTAGECET